MTPPFVIEPLADHDRSGFRCGVEALDRYFQSQVGQDVRRGLSVCFVAVDQATGAIAGFFTLSAAEVPLAVMPTQLTRRLPRYPTLPAARIGRLGVSLAYRGRKLGSALLASAALRASNSPLGVYAMVVDAKDEQAASFYRRHGFVDYASAPGALIAPLRSLLPAT